MQSICVLVNFEILSLNPPYTDIIREGLRLASVVTTRLPRSAPDEVLRYKDWDIPAGVSDTIISSNEASRESSIY